LTSLACLAQKQHRIRKIFASKTVDDFGVFGLNFIMHGVRKLARHHYWELVLVDNHFPTMWTDALKGYTPSFSRAVGKELWVMVAEKAWAKIHRNYHNISENGWVHQCIREMTGAPGYSYQTQDNPNQEANKDLFSIMLDAHKRNYILSANHGKWNHSYKRSFPIIGVSDVGGKQLIKMRNPWGKAWDGEPCTDSECWPDTLTEDLKILEHEEGSYWMCFKYFKTNFAEVMINAYEESNMVTAACVCHEPGYCTFMTCNLDAGRHTFSLTQLEKNYRTSPSYDGMGFEPCRLMLVKFKGASINDGFEYIQGQKGNEVRDVYIQADLEAGKYGVYAEMDW